MSDGPHFAVGDRVWVKDNWNRSRRSAKKAEWLKASVVKLIPPKLTGDKHLQHEYWMYRVKLDGRAEFEVHKVSSETDETIKALSPLDRMAEIQ